MSSSATLVVAGRLNEGFPKDALRTLLSNGFGPIFDGKDPNLDGEFGELADLGRPIEHSEQFGLILTNGGSASNDLIRVQFNPTADQFRSALLDALGYVLNNPTSSVSPNTEGGTESAVDKKMLVIYAGQVVAPTGEWLLSDSTLSQHLISSWLNAEAAKAWYPQLDRFPHTNDKIHLHLFTPLVGGTGCSWHADKGGHPQSLLTHVDARLVRLTLSVDASWRLQGKTVNSNDALLASHPGINSFIQRIIERHPATVLSLASEAPPLCRALSAQNPALYVFPGGGLSTEGSALFALQGFTMLLGGGFTGRTAPNWWKMVRNLPKLDAIILPDWSSSNLLSYQFIQNLLTDDVEKSNILGELLLPPAAPSATAEQNDEVTVAPPTALMHSALQMWPSSVTISDSLPAQMSLYSKLGWGELKLQPLGQRAGLVVLWKSLTNNHAPQTPPLTLLLPANPPPGTSPSQGLVKLVKTLGTVPVLNVTSAPTSTPVKQTTKAPRAPSSGSRPHTTGHVNGSAVEKPERRTLLNSSRPQTAAASSARTSSKPSTATPLKKPTPSADMRRPNATSPSRTVGSANMRKGTSPARPNATRPLGASPSRPSTGREKNNLAATNRSQRPPGATSANKPTSTRLSQTKSAAGASKPTKTTTPPTSTADRLAAHANLVASKQRPTMRNKPNDVTSKATPAPASKTAPFKVISKTSLNKLSEAKEPKEPKLAPPLSDTATVEKNVPAEQSLSDSLEGSAHEPMMSGWESTKSSLIHPHGEMGEAEPPDEQAPHPTQAPAELYKVHKFQLLNEADEPVAEEGQPVPAKPLNPEEERLENLEPSGEIRSDSLDEFEQHEKSQIDNSTEPAKTHEASPITEYPGLHGEDIHEVGHPEHPSPFGEEGIEAEHKLSPLEAHLHLLGEDIHEVGHPEHPSPFGEEGIEAEHKLSPLEAHPHLPGEDIHEVGHPEHPSPFGEEGIEAEHKLSPLEAHPHLPGEDIHEVGHPEHPSPFGEEGIEAEHKLSPLEAHPHLPGEDIHEVGHPEHPSPFGEEGIEAEHKLSPLEAHPHLPGEDIHEVGHPEHPSPFGEEGIEAEHKLSPLEAHPHLPGEDIHEVGHPEHPSPFGEEGIEAEHKLSPLEAHPHLPGEDIHEVGHPEHPSPFGEEGIEAEHKLSPLEAHPHLPGEDIHEVGHPEHPSPFGEEGIEAEHKLSPLEAHPHLPGEDIHEVGHPEHPSPFGEEGIEAEHKLSPLEAHPHLPGEDIHEVGHPEHPSPFGEEGIEAEHKLSPLEAHPHLPGEDIHEVGHPEHPSPFGEEGIEAEHKLSPLEAHLHLLGEDIHEVGHPEHPSPFGEEGIEAEHKLSPLEAHPHLPGEDIHEVGHPEHPSPFGEEGIEAEHKLSPLEANPHLPGEDIHEVGHPEHPSPFGEEGIEAEHKLSPLEAHPHLPGEDIHEVGHPEHPSPFGEEGIEAEHKLSPLEAHPHLPGEDIHEVGHPEHPSPFGEEGIEAEHKLSPLEANPHLPGEDIHEVGHPEHPSPFGEEGIEAEHKLSPLEAHPHLPGEDIHEVGHPEHPSPFGEEGIEAEHKLSPLEAHPHLPGEDIHEVGHPEHPSPFGEEGIEAEHKLSPLEAHPHLPGEDIHEVGHPEHPSPFGEEGIEAEHKLSPLEAHPHLPGEDIHEVGHPEHPCGVLPSDFERLPSDVGEFDSAEREVSLSPSKPTFGESPNPLASPASVVSQVSDADGHSLMHPGIFATTEIAPADQSEQAGTVPADALDDGHAFGSSEAQPSAADSEEHSSFAADSTSAVTPVSLGTEFVSGSGAGDMKLAQEPDSAQQQAADSTTEEDHKLPSHSIGFENLMRSPDQHEVQASIGSPDSQASVHSVVHQFTENGKHETEEALMSPTGDESPEVTSTEEKTKSGGFSIGFGDENGTAHSNQPQFGEHGILGQHEEGQHNVDAAALTGTKPTNGVHSSDLSGSLSPSSPRAEFTNGHSHHGDVGLPELPERPKGLYGDLPNPFDTDASWSPTHDDGDQQHKIPYPLQSHDELFPKFVHMDPNADNTVDRIEHDDGQSAHTFDPTKAWGQPEGLPAPIVSGNKGRPISAPGSRLSGRTAATSVGVAHGGSMDKAHTPTTLPPGPPVYLDLVWVPPYLGRVSHELATEFFARVRARIYVLSGESLHPMIGEAMIEGKAKWGPDDVNVLCKRHNEVHRTAPPESTITILPTDEPYDWGCWLRTPCGRTDHLPGEQRLEASGFRVLPSASCQDIEFSADTQTVRCEGVRLEF
ncbi:unnamed protein product [Calicophoron daubneyi]|uniref:Microtubule-associated protein 1A/B/S-like MBL-like domain-containing protein n=1 Tax=Calicophoron daubneyi TaxID=300641 RepID=A0AAV2T035_CALDB